MIENTFNVQFKGLFIYWDDWKEQCLQQANEALDEEMGDEEYYKSNWDIQDHRQLGCDCEEREPHILLSSKIKHKGESKV